MMNPCTKTLPSPSSLVKMWMTSSRDAIARERENETRHSVNLVVFIDYTSLKYLTFTILLLIVSLVNKFPVFIVII